MTDWRIEVPHRGDRDAPVVEVVAAAAEVLEGEDRAVARQVAFDALARGTTRVGQLLDELEAAGPAGCRELLDRARENCGLRATLAEEQYQTYVAANSAPPANVRDPLGVPCICAEKGCRQAEPDPRLGPGSVRMLQIRGPWFCVEHREGHEDSFRPYRSGIALNPRTGGLLELDERERERVRQEHQAESRRRQHEARLAQRQVEAAQIDAQKQAERDQYQREFPKGVVAP